ncbi:MULTISPECIES: hypothetical protein [unclassified Caballeronia]|uniref:hypothetical protein n=1 Tax=unclassified Caballeronia TaxID=2646786 RepID=UPI0020299769|nr:MULTISPECIES: hypothetical protein [unclassified Caballeronia]
MLNLYLLDLPVYRVDEQRYYRDRAEFIDRVLSSPGAEHSDRWPLRGKSHADHLANATFHLERSFGGCWLFNEIIGYIRLHFLGSQVRGEYYCVGHRRIRKTRKKQFEFQTWKLAVERNIDEKSTNEQTFAAIMKYVDHCRAELPGRYIDDSQLSRLGPFIDWRGLRQIAHREGASE